MDIARAKGLLWYERVMVGLASAKSNEGRVEGRFEEQNIDNSKSEGGDCMHFRNQDSRRGWQLPQ